MSETIEINFARPMPVFPLPGCVLLPHAALELHVFEPRYRKMVGDALDSYGLIAMGLFEGPVTQKDYEHGTPPIRDHVCVGYIEQYRAAEDGRYFLRLRGLCRARVVREEPHRPYRLFHLQPTDLSQDEDPGLANGRERLEELLSDPAMTKVEGVRGLKSWVGKPIPTTALIDIVAMQLCEDPEQRYPMLAENDPEARCAALNAYLEGLRRKAGEE